MAHRPKSTGYRGNAPVRPSGNATASKPSSRGIHSNSNNNNAAPEKRQIVGQYMVGKTIGEGTFGKVKLAVHIPTGEKVAVKILEKNKIKEQADVRRVNREIKILKKARHGNIIQLYEVLDTKSAIYLIMECAEGGELFDYIVAQKRVPEIQACKFLHQIVDGLEVLHRSEITHRDLKPENLLLKASPDGWVIKIVDFGLSNTHDGGRLLATACGSPCYAAPEMIAGKKYVGPLADLWSVGVILFALVSGYLPFEDPNTNQLYKKILSGTYQCPKWLSPEVKDLIGSILETDPRKRYTVADIRRHAWYNIVPETAVPRDVLHDHSHDLKNDHPIATTMNMKGTRTETLNAIAATGVDPKAVLDSVSSHAYNSLTALYFLFEQKHRTTHLQKAESSKSQIRQNSSNFSNRSSNGRPETISDSEQHQRPRGQHERPPAGTKPTINAHARAQQKNVDKAKLKASELPGSADAINGDVSESCTSPVRMGGVGHHQQARGAVNINPVAPYLQPPKILVNNTCNNSSTQQAHSNSSHGSRRARSDVKAHTRVDEQVNMPSLDQYMKNDLKFPDENVDQNHQDGNELSSGFTTTTGNTSKNKEKVPLLNLPKKDENNVLPDPLQSQTERRDHSNASTSKGNDPNSARAALPSVKSADKNKHGSSKPIPQLSPSARMKVARDAAALSSEPTEPPPRKTNDVRTGPGRPGKLPIEAKNPEQLAENSVVDKGNEKDANVAQETDVKADEGKPVEGVKIKQPTAPSAAPPALRSTGSSKSRRGRNISFSDAVSSGSEKVNGAPKSEIAEAVAHVTASVSGTNESEKRNDSTVKVSEPNAVESVPKRPQPQQSKVNAPAEKTITGIPSGKNGSSKETQPMNPRTMALKNKIAARGTLGVQ